MTDNEKFENAMRVSEYQHKVLEARKELWDHFHQEHGLILLDSELDEILIIAERTLDKLKDIK